MNDTPTAILTMAIISAPPGCRWLDRRLTEPAQDRLATDSLGKIVDNDGLAVNFAENAVASDLYAVTVQSYPEFLDSRRKLMAAMIRKYYESL